MKKKITKRWLIMGLLAGVSSLEATEEKEAKRAQIFDKIYSENKPDESDKKAVNKWIEGGEDAKQIVYAPTKKSVLHVACARGDVYFATYLLEKGADVNAKDSFGHTPLHNHLDRHINSDQEFLSRPTKHRYEIVKLLTGKGAHTDITMLQLLLSLETLYSHYPEGQALEMVKALSKDIEDFNLAPNGWPDEGNLVNIVLSASGARTYYTDQQKVAACRLSIIQYLVEEKDAKIDEPDAKGDTPLIKACRGKEIGIARYLAKRGAQVNAVNKKNETPLFWVSSLEDEEFAKYLIEKGAYTDINKSTYDESFYLPNAFSSHLSNAFKNGNDDYIRYLIKKIDLDPKEEKGILPPLLGAVKHEKLDWIKYLLKKEKVSIHKKDSAGRNALHYLVLNQNKEIAAYLLENNLEPNLPDKHGRTPLHYICMYKKGDLLKYLLKKYPNIDLSIRDDLGRTPLHWACFEHRELGEGKLEAEEIDLLINASQIKLNLLDDEFGKKTALDYCTPGTLLFKKLEAKGAKTSENLSFWERTFGQWM